MKVVLVSLIAAVALAVPGAALASTFTQTGYGLWTDDHLCTNCDVRIVNNGNGHVTYAYTNSNGFWSYNFTYGTEYHLYLQYAIGYCSYTNSIPYILHGNPIGGNLYLDVYGNAQESGCPTYPEG